MGFRSDFYAFLALGLKAQDRSASRRAMDEVLLAMDGLMRDRPERLQSWLSNLLPVIERIDTALVPEVFWRYVASRPPSVNPRRSASILRPIRSVTSPYTTAKWPLRSSSRVETGSSTPRTASCRHGSPSSKPGRRSTPAPRWLDSRKSPLVPTRVRVTPGSVSPARSASPTSSVCERCGQTERCQLRVPRRGVVARMMDWFTPSKIVTFLLVKVTLKPPPAPVPSSLIGVPAASSSLAVFPMKFWPI